MMNNHSDDTKNDVDNVTCTLQHHGAAASTCPNVIAWIPSSSTNSASGSSTLVYASHGIVNLSQQVHLQIGRCASGGGGESQDQQDDTAIWNVTQTLRTATASGSNSADAGDCKRTITALAYITPPVNCCNNNNNKTTMTALATGFSDGTITVWIKKPSSSLDFDNDNTETCWKEFIVEHPPTLAKTATATRSITALDALLLSDNHHIVIVTGSSAGAQLYICALDQEQQLQEEHGHDLSMLPCIWNQTLLNCCISSVRLILNSDLGLVVLSGTAAPRHNRIHVYHANEFDLEKLFLRNNNENTTTSKILHHAGSLTGHEDWISCMAWNTTAASSASYGTSSLLLATGSQDCRIRLWKFTTIQDSNEVVHNAELNSENDNNNIDDDSSSGVQSQGSDDDDDDEEEEEEDEEGESRLEIYHDHHNQQHDDALSSLLSKAITRVTLEALLMGHEERVTAVCWHPKPSNHVQNSDDGDNNQNNHGERSVDYYYLLISSSMDRSILLWAPSRDDGIWTPITRVGSAGGILGGSVGSTLLGYLNVVIEPIHGQCLIGHAYGGSLHVWNRCTSSSTGTTSIENQNETITTAASSPAADDTCSFSTNNMIQWRAQPCVTGHFDGVTDLCWEATTGEYLLTTSLDQTCRLWAPVCRARKSNIQHDRSNNNHPVWIELARPQVHGYNLSAVTSLSTRAHPHLLVTGADEKELRAFDAPMSTIRTLQGISGVGMSNNINKDIADDPIHRVDRAYIPSLGLSNRATATDAAEEDDVPEEESSHHSSAHRIRLPLERDLGAVSLWPEIRKLYGHDTELYCLASTLAARTSSSSSDKNDSPILVASSCKARNVDDAAIRLWNVEQGKCHQVLKGGHKSTVATLAFSPDDGQFLASSGKDRRLCLWQKKKKSDSTASNSEYELAWAKDVAHRRIVWSVHFLPWKTSTSSTNGPHSHHILASGSRDGCIKIWRTRDSNNNINSSTESSSNSNSGVVLEELVSFSPAFCVKGKPDAVTALAFGPKPCRPYSLSSTAAEDNNGTMTTALLAVGLESGRLELWKVCIPAIRNNSEKTTTNATAATAMLALSLPPWQCHLATITKLAWKPQQSDPVIAKEDESSMSSSNILASSSMDHGVRIYQVQY